MAYTFDRVAYKGWDNRNYRFDPEAPPRPTDVRAYKVVVYDPETGDTHQYWSVVKSKLLSDDEWFVYIGAQSARHGMPLEDGGGDFEPPPDDEDFDDEEPEEDEDEEEEESPTVRQRLINVITRLGRWFR